MRYAAGQYANLLERALTITMAPSADSLFPAANLYDGRPQRPSMHGSNSANPMITVDLAAFTPVNSGSETFAARAGERRQILSTDTTSTRIRNLSTGNYLTSGGTWQASATSCLTGSGQLSYVVETLEECQSPTVNLEMTIVSGAGYLSDWPRWNAAVIFGHNIDPGLTVELRSSTDAFTGDDTLEDTGTVRQPAFYMEASATVASRYARIELTGTNQSVPWYGELILCYLETTVFNPNYPIEVSLIEPQVRHASDLGTVHVHNLAQQPRRAVKLPFATGVTGEAELREELVLRSRGGAYPMVCVPVDDEPLVVFIRLEDSWTVLRTFLSWWEGDLVGAEDPVAVPLV